MPPYNQSELSAITGLIQQSLISSPYACCSIERLPSGTTNFVYRGQLTEPLPKEGESAASQTSVIVKYSAGSISGNKDFPIDITRSSVEVSMLQALHSFIPSKIDGYITIKTPRMLYFDPSTNIQVLSDFPCFIDLMAMLHSPHEHSFDQIRANCIGHALGKWLSVFHTWASTNSEQLKCRIGTNESMRELKRRITYDAFLNVLDNFPTVNEHTKKALKNIQTVIFKDLEARNEWADGEEYGFIHGDFWAGNVLLPNASPPTRAQSQGLSILIIDWEFAQYNHRSIDLGQIIGDLYERAHFCKSPIPLHLLEAFCAGYGGMSDDLAFRTAIHAAVHLICWYTRGPPGGPPGFSREIAEEAMAIGVQWILKGWEKDKTWFEESVLRGIFKQQ